ncbi:MAG: carboxypeptidase regulatory-like domain-containing protein, partial [Acidobacteriota bacterium]
MPARFPQSAAFEGLKRLAHRYLWPAVALCALAAPAPAWAQGNDACDDAVPIAFGDAFEVELSSATADGVSTCDGGGVRDRWYRWVAPRSERSFALVQGQGLSVHSMCPGSVATQVACGGGELGAPGFFGLGFQPTAGETYFIRVAETEAQTGPVTLSVAPGGVIEGTVTDQSGTPLAGLDVSAGFKQTQTDADGRYRLGGFETGELMVYAGLTSPYIAELFDDIPCPFRSCLPLGEEIAVAPGVTATANFALTLGAAISGAVTDELTGEPLRSQLVSLFGRGGAGVNIRTSTFTDVDGRYRFEGLLTGSYVLLADGDNGYAREYWEDLPCIRTACSPDTATPIVIVGDEDAAGFDFTLERALELSGTVRDAGTGEPVPDGRMRLRGPDGEVLALEVIRTDGSYRFQGLLAGTYLVSTAADPYVDEIWPDIPCGYEEDCPSSTATPIVLVDQSVDGVDFELDLGGTLVAEVVDELTQQPIGSAEVALYDDGGDLISLRRRESGTGGSVVFPGLPPGVYRALASTSDFSHAAEIYADLDCPGGPETCGSIDLGTPIPSVGAESQTVRFTLEERDGTCRPDFNTLCLNDERFAVRARWRTENGAEGADLHIIIFDELDAICRKRGTLNSGTG